MANLNILKNQVLIKFDYRYGLKTLVSINQTHLESWSRRGRRFCSSTSDVSVNKGLEQFKAPSDSLIGDVVVKYIRGLPHVTVPLPSRNEKCQFTLRPVSHNVGDFLDMLKAEDRGIDRAAILNNEGVRIASACSIESLMDDCFWLHLNDKHYFVQPPVRDKISAEELTRLGDVKALVAQLYEALHVGEHQIKKERQLFEQLELLNEKLGPLEKQKDELAAKADRKANVLTWVGLGLMSVQFGVLARLTWWEYSWDIMEPVTYFVTYGTAMACYAYFVLTKQEYLLPDVKDRQELITLHKLSKKTGLDLEEYNRLKREIAQIEYDLRRLRDPLYMHLPGSPPDSPNYSQTEIESAKKLEAKLNEYENLVKIGAGESSKINKISSLLEMATKRLKK